MDILYLWCSWMNCPKNYISKGQITAKFKMYGTLSKFVAKNLPGCQVVGLLKNWKNKISRDNQSYRYIKKTKKTLYVMCIMPKHIQNKIINHTLFSYKSHVYLFFTIFQQPDNPTTRQPDNLASSRQQICRVSRTFWILL